MTLPAFADTWYIDDGDISISAGETGNKVTQGSTTKENDTDTVIKSKDSSTASSNTVTIHADEGKTVNVTLDNVTINVDEGSKYAYDPNAYKTAVSVTGSGNTNIELNGNNTLTSGYGHAGLEHNKTDDSGTLTIQDEKNDDGSAKGSASDTTGSLTATVVAEVPASAAVTNTTAKRPLRAVRSLPRVVMGLPVLAAVPVTSTPPSAVTAM